MHLRAHGHVLGDTGMPPFPATHPVTRAPPRPPDAPCQSHSPVPVAILLSSRRTRNLCLFPQDMTSLIELLPAPLHGAPPASFPPPRRPCRRGRWSASPLSPVQRISAPCRHHAPPLNASPAVSTPTPLATSLSISPTRSYCSLECSVDQRAFLPCMHRQACARYRGVENVLAFYCTSILELFQSRSCFFKKRNRVDIVKSL
jgi:hypothetical protein